MATLKEKVALAAQTLITAAGFTAAVMATNINEQARLIKQASDVDTSSVEASAIARSISDEIKKRHVPGISGNL